MSLQVRGRFQVGINSQVKSQEVILQLAPRAGKTEASYLDAQGTQ